MCSGIVPGGGAFISMADDLVGGGLLGDGIIGAAPLKTVLPSVLVQVSWTKLLVVKTWPLLDVHVPGTAVKTVWPLLEIKGPGTASLLAPGDPCAPSPVSGTPGCVACVSYTMLVMRGC